MQITQSGHAVSTIRYQKRRIPRDREAVFAYHPAEYRFQI
jgi:hypothetical protein